LQPPADRPPFLSRPLFGCSAAVCSAWLALAAGARPDRPLSLPDQINIEGYLK
jgi:hypothetical protein